LECDQVRLGTTECDQGRQKESGNIENRNQKCGRRDARRRWSFGEQAGWTRRLNNSGSRISGKRGCASEAGWIAGESPARRIGLFTTDTNSTASPGRAAHPGHPRTREASRRAVVRSRFHGPTLRPPQTSNHPAQRTTSLRLPRPACRTGRGEGLSLACGRGRAPPKIFRALRPGTTVHGRSWGVTLLRERQRRGLISALATRSRIPIALVAKG
jgi:hypothetical protein